MVPTISIVIPAYNEVTRLAVTLGDLVAFLDSHRAAVLLVVGGTTKAARYASVATLHACSATSFECGSG